MRVASKVSSHCSGDHHVPKTRIDPNTSNGGATYLSMVGWHYFKGLLHSLIPYFLLLSLLFISNRVLEILTMWTRAFCNSFRTLISATFLTVNKKHERMYGLKTKSSVDHHNMTRQMQMKTTHKSHTTPRVRLTVALPRKVIVEIGRAHV